MCQHGITKCRMNNHPVSLSHFMCYHHRFLFFAHLMTPHFFSADEPLTLTIMPNQNGVKWHTTSWKCADTDTQNVCNALFIRNPIRSHWLCERFYPGFLYELSLFFFQFLWHWVTVSLCHRGNSDTSLRPVCGFVSVCMCVCVGRGGHLSFEAVSGVHVPGR